MISCPICDSKEASIYKQATSADIVSCDSCSLIYVNKIDKNYLSQYLNNETSSADYYLSSKKYDIKTFRQRLQLLEKYSKRENLMDVGCNCGTFIEVALSRGWEAIGVEPNAIAAKEAQKKGAVVLNTFFDETIAKLYFNKVSAVYLGDTIEHVANPQLMLENVKKVLKTGGTVMIVTPNIGSFLAKKFQIKPREHLVYFSKKTLSKLIKQAGLQLIYLKLTGRYRNVSAIQESTSINTQAKKIIVTIIQKLGLSNLMSIGLRWLVRDEVIAIARKL